MHNEQQGTRSRKQRACPRRSACLQPLVLLHRARKDAIYNRLTKGADRQFFQLKQPHSRREPIEIDIKILRHQTVWRPGPNVAKSPSRSVGAIALAEQ
jgi:hypothetical protein